MRSEEFQKNIMQKIGIIGAGSFGTAVANLIAYNSDVLLYSRNENTIQSINEEHFHKNTKISKNILATNDMERIANSCNLIFPIVPSKYFRSMMQDFSPFLRPHHILIHGTKGFSAIASEHLRAKDIHTISEVIQQESSVVRIGCLSGPNISKEILSGQPAATVIASRFTEVINEGKKVLKSKHFQVYSSMDIRGAEIAGALKNIIAIGSGILRGLELGHNLWGLLITRGLTEMIHFGKALGSDVKPFFGVAGIGDLVTTASSQNSRNFTVGYHLAKGKSIQEISEMMEEVAEGVHTVLFAKKIADKYNLKVPITRMVYKIIHEDYSIDDAFNYLIQLDYEHDVDYL